MTENKDDSKEKKDPTNSTENANQEDIRGLKSVTLKELGKQYKSENIGELLKELSKAGNITIGNLFIGDAHIQGDAVGRDKTKQAKRHSKKVLPKGVVDKTAKWLDDIQSIEDRILLLSVAVFNGASVKIVTDAQKMLQELISENDTDKKTTKSVLFESSIHKRLQNIQARIKDGEEDTQYGRIRTKVVELDDISLAPLIVKYYWDEFKFDPFHEYLVRWLREAAENTPFQMRVRAAAAVGELLKNDFRPIEIDILNNWAISSNPTTRTAAAIAISVPALEDEWAPQVLNLLHYWSTVNNWRLCWTATAAYAGPIGIKFPVEALKDLKRVAEAGDLRLIGVLTQSISNLFNDGEAKKDLYEKILDSLVDWTENSKDIQGTIGIFVFLNLARTARIKADPEGDDWYTLLWLIQNRNKYPSKQIFVLWRRALNYKQSRADAIKLLNEWIKAVDKDGRLYESLEWLISEIRSGGEKREVDRLKYYLQKMEEQPESSATAERLLRII